MADKIYLPNDSVLLELILHEYHNTTAHPAADQTLLKVSRMFW
jgi:hypothetical protein